MSLLQVYYNIDTQENCTDLHRALKFYLTKHFSNYTTINTQQINQHTNQDTNQETDQHTNETQATDVITKGFTYMKNLFRKLKLKHSHETWFIYITHGDIRGFDKTATLVLINKEPGNNKYIYYLDTQNPIISSSDPITVQREKVEKFLNILHTTFQKNKSIRAN